LQVIIPVLLVFLLSIGGATSVISADCCGNGICEWFSNESENCGNCPADCAKDLDGDGYLKLDWNFCPPPLGTDYNDNNKGVNPIVAENCSDDVDNNQNGQTNEGCVCKKNDLPVPLEPREVPISSTANAILIILLLIVGVTRIRSGK